MQEDVKMQHSKKIGNAPVAETVRSEEGGMRYVGKACIWFKQDEREFNLVFDTDNIKREKDGTVWVRGYYLAVYKNASGKILVGGYGGGYDGGYHFRRNFGDEIDEEIVNEVVDEGIAQIYDDVDEFIEYHKDVSDEEVEIIEEDC